MSSAFRLNSRYEIKEIVGEGGMGIVYRAIDRDLKRDVALKTIKELLDSQQLELFLRECDVLKKLEHPNIINLYDAGISEDGGQQKPFFVMPFLPGATLDKLILSHAARLTPDRVVDIITQTAKGLQAAHDIGLIHRDVKPSNIFVLNDDSIKLIDFGVVHLTGQHSRTGFKGTLPYMSPEVWELNPPTAASDVFSLAVVCYEALVRRRPFTGSTENEIREAILRATPPPISDLNPAVSLALSQVVHAALAKQPWNRTSSARQFAEELQKALHNQPIERFDPSRIEPRVVRAQRALETSQYDFAAEIVAEIEAEGHIHPTIRSLRRQIDQALKEKAVKQALESARHRFAELEYQLALQKVDEVLRRDANNSEALALKNEIDVAQKSQQIENWFRHAQDHLKNYAFSHARQALQNVLRLKPTNTVALQMISEVDRRENEYLRAHGEKEELYKAALEAWQRGEVSVAFSRLERVLELDRRAPDSVTPESAASYQNLYEQVRSEHDRINNAYQEARKLLGENDFDGSSSICEQILAKYPDHPLFQALKEDAGERKQQYVSSYIIKIDRDVEAEPDLDRKVDILTEAKRLYPTETRFRERLDNVARRRDLVAGIKQKVDNLEERGQYAEALGQLEILRAIYPQYPGMDWEVDRISKRRDQKSKTDTKARWVNQIDTALNAGDFSHALNLLKAALVDFPDDAELLAQERLAGHGQDRAREATQVFETAHALCAQGDLKGGIEGLWQAFLLDKRNPVIQAVLVETLLKRASTELDTNPELSEQLVGKAMELDPGNRQAVNLQRLILDRQKERAVDQILSQSRQDQAVGDINSALNVLQQGLGSYPEEGRLIARKEALLKIEVPRRPDDKEVREIDLRALDELQNQITSARDAADFDVIKERSIAIARKYPGDPGVQSVFRSIEELWATNPKALAKPKAPQSSVPQELQESSAPSLPPELHERTEPDQPTSDLKQRLTPILATFKSLPPKRLAIFAAIPVALILLVLIITIRAPKTPPVVLQPPPEATVEINASVPGAHIVVDGKDVGLAPIKNLKLGEGQHTIDATLAGYGSKEPVRFQVGNGAPTPPSTVDVLLEPLTPVLRVSTELRQGLLDNEKLMLDGTGFEKLDLPNGLHVLQLSSPIAGPIRVEFEMTAGQIPVVQKVESSQTLVVALAALKDRGQLHSSSKSLKVSLNGAEAQPIGEQSMSLGLPLERNLLVLDDAKSPITVGMDMDANPVLTIFIGAQPNAGSLEVTETGKLDATVSVEPVDKKGPARTQKLRNGRIVFSGLEPKTYTVEVSAPGYETVKATALVVKGDLAKVPPLTLAPSPATLSIADGTPGADIFVDNASAGKLSPTGTFTSQMTLGKHRIQLRKADFEDGPVVELDFAAGNTTRLSAAESVLKPHGWIDFKISPASAINTITYRPATGSAPIPARNNETSHVKAGRYSVSVAVANGYQGIEESVDVEAGKGTSFSRTLLASVPVNTTRGGAAPVVRPVVIGKEGLDAPQPQVPFNLFRQRIPGTYSFNLKPRRTLTLQKRAKWVVNFIDNKNYVEYEIDEKSLKYTTHQNGKEQTKSVQHRLNGITGDVYELTVSVSANEVVVSCAGQRIALESPAGVGNLLAGKFGFSKDENVDMESFRFTGTQTQ